MRMVEVKTVSCLYCTYCIHLLKEGLSIPVRKAFKEQETAVKFEIDT